MRTEHPGQCLLLLVLVMLLLPLLLLRWMVYAVRTVITTIVDGILCRLVYIFYLEYVSIVYASVEFIAAEIAA